jgi:hypothetical protein
LAASHYTYTETVTASKLIVDALGSQKPQEVMVFCIRQGGQFLGHAVVQVLADALLLGGDLDNLTLQLLVPGFPLQKTSAPSLTPGPPS